MRLLIVAICLPQPLHRVDHPVCTKDAQANQTVQGTRIARAPILPCTRDQRAE